MGGTGWALAGPALDLPLRAVLIIRSPCASAAQARDPIAHVEQHYFQGIGIHPALIGLRSPLHVLNHSSCEVFALRGAKKEGKWESLT